MPIWLELVTLLLFTYAVGLGIGWLLWSRSLTGEAHGPGEEGLNPRSEGDTAS